VLDCFWFEGCWQIVICIEVLKCSFLCFRRQQVKGGCTQAYGLGWQCRPNECIFGSGKPRGVRILGGRVYEPGEEMGKLVYEQPGNEVDGSCHSKEGSK
jgi:hypothetical protein